MKTHPTDSLIQKQVAHYDKIIKENIAAIIPGLLKKVLRIDAVLVEDIKQDLQHTKERKPDLLQIVTDTIGHKFILHIEFQVKDDPEMPYRMLDYKAMAIRKFKMPVKQFVVYLGEEIPKVPPTISDDNLWYAYHVAPIAIVDYHNFINSNKPEEIIFAILGNFGNEQAEKVVEDIVNRLEETSEGLNLQKAIEQLRMLSNLRKLQPIVDTIMEHISTYFKIENDVLYIKGQRDALLKTEEKIREAEEKIRKEQQKLYEEQQKRYEAEQQKLYEEQQKRYEVEQQKLYEEQQKRYEAEQQKRYEAEQQTKQNQYDVVTNLILSTNLPNETIANIANVTLLFVEDLRKTLTPK
jgi:hypothetical protein